jgi:hypothetical protein
VEEVYSSEAVLSTHPAAWSHAPEDTPHKDQTRPCDNISTLPEDAQHEGQIHPRYSQYDIYSSLKTHSTKIKHDPVAIKMLSNPHELKSFFNVACSFIDILAI